MPLFKEIRTHLLVGNGASWTSGPRSRLVTVLPLWVGRLACRVWRSSERGSLRFGMGTKDRECSPEPDCVGSRQPDPRRRLVPEVDSINYNCNFN